MSAVGHPELAQRVSRTCFAPSGFGVAQPQGLTPLRSTAASPRNTMVKTIPSRRSSTTEDSAYPNSRNPSGKESPTATNIADQDQITHFDALSPSITLALDPGIKRGLRFLEQCDKLQSGKLCGLECQFAR